LGRSEPRITETTDTESADMGAQLYLKEFWLCLSSGTYSAACHREGLGSVAGVGFVVDRVVCSAGLSANADFPMPVPPLLGKVMGAVQFT
jgi:hypothetical protein